MSYPISSEVLELFKRQQRQVAEIKMYGTTETITLTESDIRQGGLTIDRYCISGSRRETGSAVAAELALTLDNNDGRFDDTVFEGAELFVRIGIKKWEARRWEKATVQYIPMGYFTVDNPPRKLSSISLSALDRMVLFDKECKPEDISFPINIDTLLVRICSICGVTLATNSTTLTNCEYIVDKFPESDNLTYRQILMWIAEITGTCAYIDWNGQLRLEWYGEESSATLSPDMRYSSDLNDKTITITGVRIVASDETVYLQGTDEYAFNIESNGLLQSNIAVVATALNEKLNGFTYTPYSCVAKPLVHLYPLDRVDFVDKKGNKVSSIVTNATFTMNANLSLAGQGETETANSYAKANPITKQEAAIINKIKNVIDTQITTRQQALIGLNETIVNSLGLYFTEELLEDGSTVYYYHDQPKKENSSIIYTFRAGGFAWTDKWEGDETVWQNGIDRNGNAVLNILSAFQITADHIQAGSITADRLAIDFTQNIVTQDELSETSQTLRQEFTAADGELTSKIGEARTYAESQAKSAEDNANAATDEKLTAYSTTTEMNSAIEQKANSITLSVSQQITETRAYADSVASDAEDNANAATDEKLTAYSTTTEMNSAIEVVNNRIGLLVTETTNGDVINSASIIAAINGDTSSITIDASKLELTSYVKTGEVYDEAYAAAEDAIEGGITLSASNGESSSTIRLRYNGVTVDSVSVSFSGMVTFDDLENEGSTVINGANITTGTISADYIDTENLACTKLYAKNNYSGYTARLNGNFGDFGIFNSLASDNDYSNDSTCLFGIYNSVPNVNFYVYGHNFMGVDVTDDTVWAKGTWDFSVADVVGIEGGSGSSIAVFG